MCVILALEGAEALREFSMRYRQLTHFDEDSDDLDASFDGPLGIHHISSHDHTVFAEGEGGSGRMFQADEPVTICDQFGLFFRRKPKGAT
jgi:hypothetical protein